MTIHKYEQLFAVGTGPVVYCRCGWMYWITDGTSKGDGLKVIGQTLFAEHLMGDDGEFPDSPDAENNLYAWSLGKNRSGMTVGQTRSEIMESDKQ